MTQWPEGNVPSGERAPRKRVECPVCGEIVAEPNLAAHQKGSACQNVRRERALLEQGWLNAGTRAGRFLAANITTLSVGGCWWAPAWAVIAQDSMKSWQGARDNTVRKILVVLKKDEQAQRAVVHMARQRHRHLVVPPAFLLSLLPALNVTTSIVNLERGYGLRTFYQWLARLSEENWDHDIRLAAAERAYAIINEVRTVEPDIASGCFGLFETADKRITEIRGTQKCYFPSQKPKPSDSWVGS